MLYRDKVFLRPTLQERHYGRMHPDSEAFFVALGKRIREVRKQKGWTVRQMVVEHGYQDSHWRKYENGCPITIDSLLKISSIFSMPLVRLLDGLGDFPKDADPLSKPASKKAAKTSPAKDKVLALK